VATVTGDACLMIGGILFPLVGIVGVGPVGDDGWLWSGLAWLTLFALSLAAVRSGLQTAREGGHEQPRGFCRISLPTGRT